MKNMIDRSLEIIADGQAPSGAYVACPDYPTYRYCWFRDGTFIAQAAARWGEHAGAARFYDWAARIVLAREAAVERCIATALQGRPPDPADLLHTRYTLDGQPGSDDWPNFQLDGFGTLLWGITSHLGVGPRLRGGLRLRSDGRNTPTAVGPIAENSPDRPLEPGHTEWLEDDRPATWRRAMRLLVRYLAALWQWPNADCWEEFPDRIAVSTLAALHAGLHAAAGALGAEDAEGQLAARTAAQIRDLVLARGARDGHLIKQIDGEDVVDASLLWACVPFGSHGLLGPDDPLMRATADRIIADLTGATGGIHRYRADTFYGGGEWMLLTALLGEYHAALEDRVRTAQCRDYVERHADAAGRLPEQSSAAPLAPAYVAEWIDRWGPVARPLLWSHAAYLGLRAALDGVAAPAGEGERAGRLECRWQREQLPDATRELILDDQRLRNDIYWSVFDC